MEKVLEIERGSTRSHSVEEHSLWMKLWTCRKKEYGMSGYLEVFSVSLLFFFSFNIHKQKLQQEFYQFQIG